MLIAGGILIKKKIEPSGSKWYGKLGTVAFYICFVSIMAMEITNINIIALKISFLCVTIIIMIYALIRYAIIFVKSIKKNDKELNYKELLDIKRK